MAIQLGSAYGKIIIDSSGVAVGIGSAVKNIGSLQTTALKLGATLKNVGQMMTIGLTLPILAIGAASIKAASDLEETRNKVRVVFGDMSEDVLQFGEDAATGFGMSKREALEAAGTFGNLFTSMGLGRESSAEMSMGLVKLAADLASFNNLDPTLVLEKLRSGLVGEVEPLRTLGINLTMAATKAKALELGLADANGEVSQAALLQARYALILEQSTNAQGDFARTAEGMANQSRILKAELTNAAAELGENLLPIALKVVQGLNRLLEIFAKLPEPIQNAIIILAGLVAVMGPILSLIGTIVGIAGSIAGLVTTLGSLGISVGAVGAALGTAATAIVGFGAAALTVIAPLLLIIATIYLVYLAFKNNFMGITTTVKQLWEIIKHYFTMIRDWIIKSLTNVKWSDIGKSILFGIANGMLMGIPSLIVAATKAAKFVLETFDRELDSHSPSRKMFLRGAWAGQGFTGGLEQSLRPEDIAKRLARPTSQAANSSRQEINMHFGHGVTVRQVQNMISTNGEDMLGRLNRALEGVE